MRIPVPAAAKVEALGGFLQALSLTLEAVTKKK
jgi:hypothetical protein